MTEYYNNEYSCPECFSKDIIYDKGEVIYRKCGIVIEHHCMDTGGGVNYFPDDDPLYPRVVTGKFSFGRGTRIRSNNKDDSGRQIKPEASSNMYRLRKAEKWFDPKDRRRKAIVTIRLKQLLTRTRLQFVVTKAMEKEMLWLVKRAIRIGIAWSNYLYLAAAAFCFVYTRWGNPNPIKRLAEVTKINPRRFFKDYTRLTASKEIQKFFKAREDRKIRRYIDEVTTALKLPISLEILIFGAYEKVMANGNFVGKDRRGVLAGLVYLICESNHHKRTQAEIAKLTNITEVTLRTRKKEIEKLISP